MKHKSLNDICIGGTYFGKHIFRWDITFTITSTINSNPQVVADIRGGNKNEYINLGLFHKRPLKV